MKKKRISPCGVASVGSHARHSGGYIISTRYVCTWGESISLFMGGGETTSAKKREDTAPEVFSSHIQIGLFEPAIVMHIRLHCSTWAPMCAGPQNNATSSSFCENIIIFFSLFSFFPFSTIIFCTDEKNIHGNHRNLFPSSSPWMVSRRIFVFSICYFVE